MFRTVATERSGRVLRASSVCAKGIHEATLASRVCGSRDQDIAGCFAFLA